MATKEYVLILTVDLPDYMDSSRTNLYMSELQTHFEQEFSQSLTEAELTEAAIKKVFYYGNIFVCVVDLEEITGRTSRMDATNDIIMPIVAKLFPAAENESIAFRWAAIPRDDVKELDLTTPIIQALGESGGAGLRSG